MDGMNPHFLYKLLKFMGAFLAQVSFLYEYVLASAHGASGPLVNLKAQLTASEIAPFNLFAAMLNNMNTKAISILMRGMVPVQQPQPQAQQEGLAPRKPRAS